MKTRILWIVFLVSIFGFIGCGDEGGNLHILHLVGFPLTQPAEALSDSDSDSMALSEQFAHTGQ